MGKLSGKVAFVTGAARGQGRSHAIRLANEGARVIAVDCCGGVRTSPYPVASADDLTETEKLVTEAGGEIIARRADVRDLESLRNVVKEGIEVFGGLDIVVANAGIWSTAPTWELEEDQWQEMIDINLTGVWKTVKATLPSMLERDAGGSIILISSQGGLSGFMGLAHYVAAKHGIIGLMNVLAQELGPRRIRVNAICPCSVNTMMFDNSTMRGAFCPGVENPSDEEFLEAASRMTLLPIPYVEVADVSNAVIFLASDDARYITGLPMRVDGGGLVKAS